MAGRAATQVRSIIEMAHKSDLTVVAEGIEQQDQATILAELGCDCGQGFLFGRPTPPEETTDADLRQLVKCRNMAPR
jgi:EAL domain-containing protein (putative c-di-GMP-specific phosphodiesterase class I)